MKLPAMFALAVCCSLFARAADAPGVKATNVETKKRTFRLNLSLEDNRPGKIKTEFRAKNDSGGRRAGRAAALTLEDLMPGTEEITLPDVPDDTYTVYFSSPGYAGQWQRVVLDAQTKEPVELKAQLARTRYAVLRYAYNASGGRELSGRIIEGRAAVAHWGALPFFSRDWQVWQKGGNPGAGNGSFADTLYLDFHRQTRGFGFIEAPKGLAFDQLKEAPAGNAYQCRSTKAEKGLTLFCRVNGDRPEASGYGKIVIEEITETPPAGIKIIDGQ